MSTEHRVTRDERIVAIENAAYKWAYSLLAWPLVIDALYRQKVRHEEVGDLIALIVASGAFGMLYMIKKQAMVLNWPWTSSKTVVVFAVCVVAAILVAVLAGI